MSNGAPLQERVLFLAADPDEMTRLNLGNEMREVRVALERGTVRKFDLVTSPAQRLSDLQHELDRVGPCIVHFGGHGSQSRQEIVFLDDKGNAVPVNREALAVLLGGYEGVVLNACSSLKQAEAIAERGPWAIGMAGRISNEAAVVFAHTLYLKLADGKEPEESCVGATLQLKLTRMDEAARQPKFFPGKARRASPSKVTQSERPRPEKFAAPHTSSPKPTPHRRNQFDANGEFEVTLMLKKPLGKRQIEEHIRRKLKRSLQGDLFFEHNGASVLVSGHVKVPPPAGEVLSKQFRYDDVCKEPSFFPPGIIQGQGHLR